MFGKNLKELRKRLGYSMDAFIALYNSTYSAHMNKSTLSRYENDLQEPMYSTAVNIANLFNVSVDSMAKLDFSSIDFPKENSASIPDGFIPMPKMKEIPLVGTIACGTPILAEQNIEQYVSVPEDIKADFALRCKGDSMINARIYDGDIVYIKQQPQVENGEIAAVIIDDEATLKRFYQSGNKVTLVAENNGFQPLVYTEEEINHVRIVGRAVGFTSTDI